MFGGLHIELAALKMVGDWLQGSGWVHALVQAEITTPGTADSFWHASHITRTRRAHQVTASALYILQKRAYYRSCQIHPTEAGEIKNFQGWCHNRTHAYPQFQYWATVLEIEVLILSYVRSLRQASFTMYLDALTELAAWFHALDRTNYARWIPVHLKDMAELSTKQPDVAAKFRAGSFIVQKTHRVFSSIPIDQAHEQNNALIKGDGGAVGLTDNPSALRRWMIAGPEIAAAIQEFEEDHLNSTIQMDTQHHDQIDSVQATFTKYIISFVNVIEDLGNPFEEESMDLVVLDSNKIASLAVVDAVRNVKMIGKVQFETFTRERLVERTKPIDDIISRNNLKVFVNPRPKRSNKGKHQLACT